MAFAPKSILVPRDGPSVPYSHVTVQLCQHACHLLHSTEKFAKKLNMSCEGSGCVTVTEVLFIFRRIILQQGMDNLNSLAHLLLTFLQPSNKMYFNLVGGGCDWTSQKIGIAKYCIIQIKSATRHRALKFAEISQVSHPF